MTKCVVDNKTFFKIKEYIFLDQEVKKLKERLFAFNRLISGNAGLEQEEIHVLLKEFSDLVRWEIYWELDEHIEYLSHQLKEKVVKISQLENSLREKGIQIDCPPEFLEEMHELPF